MKINNLEIAFIGCGSVGRPLGKLLAAAGAHIGPVCCRTTASAETACRFLGHGRPLDASETARAAASAKVVIVATPDRVIAEADRAAAPGLGPGQVILHLSGAFPSTILRESRRAGADIGSMHPLQSFTDPAQSLDQIAGAVFACEGDAPALAAARSLAEAVGASPITIATDRKALYHAAAVTASNSLVALLCLAADLMEASGMERGQGLEALQPLIHGTLQNILSRGTPQALTGPVARGDVDTIRSHLEALGDLEPACRHAYATLGHLTVEAALRNGTISPQQAEEFQRLLDR